MMAGSHQLFWSFNGTHVEVLCDTEQLALDLRLRLGHLATGTEPASRGVLRLVLNEIQASWIDLCDSTGRNERGSIDHLLHYIRKWATSAFVSGSPHLLWLHAGAAALDGAVVLLPGDPGAGKSTLTVRLVERSWRFFADDAVPLDLNRRTALPLPFNPSVRTEPSSGGDWPAFLEQPKVTLAVPPDQVATASQPVGAIVFPEFSPGDTQVLSPLSAASAARSLIAHCLRFDEDKARTIRGLFRLAEALPAFHLRYGDPAATAAELTRRWPELSGRLHSSGSASARR